MVFGRCFEKALGAYFCQEDSAAVLFKEWEACRDASFEFRKGESWDRLFHQGVHLLETFARDNRIRIRDPKKNLQIKMLRTLPGGSEFVAYLDALGEVDDQHSVIDWKTTTSRYSTDPERLLSLDLQLICYSWITELSDVAFVVFVRKHAPEIRYLKASISEEQRQEFGRLVETTINQIETGHFVSHSGIRFPQNGCLTCPHLELCLGNKELVNINLIRKSGRVTLIGLTSLWMNGRSTVPLEINRRRAVFVLGKIDEILSWEKIKEQEKDTRFVELGECLCEVRANQYWRLEKLRRFPGSRRKAYYLIAIHENLTRIPKPQL